MRRPLPTGSCRSLLLAAALAAAVAGCGKADDAGSRSAVATDGTAMEEPTTSTTVATGAKATLPDDLRSVSTMAGGDPQEAQCIDEGLAAGVKATPTATDDMAVESNLAGTVVVRCLPPAKLAAAVAERVRAGALTAPADPAYANCIRAALVTSAQDPAYATFIGAVAVADGGVAKANISLFAACSPAVVAAPDTGG